MKIRDFLGKAILFPLHILSWIFLGMVGLGNIAVIILVFLVAPLSLIFHFRKLFPNEAIEYVIRFEFSWYDLIFYIPAMVLGYFLLVKWVYPISKLTFINFIVWPIKETFKKQ